MKTLYRPNHLKNLFTSVQISTILSPGFAALICERSVTRLQYVTSFSHHNPTFSSLHEEVLAQRALDRRLTEELTRFKSSITLLTRELHEVQDHDREVTRQAMETQNEVSLLIILILAVGWFLT